MSPFATLRASVCATLAVMSAAMASQNTLVFQVSNAVSPAQPSATVTLWAAFDPKWYAFNKTATEVFTEFDRGWFSDPVALLNNDGFSEPGEVLPDGDRVSNIFIMQVYISFSRTPDESNPIALWSVTWTTDDFTPRQVDLGTQSESFEVYEDAGAHHDMFGVDFAEGSGSITVIPAPVSTLVLAGLGAGMARRRRPARRGSSRSGIGSRV